MGEGETAKTSMLTGLPQLMPAMVLHECGGPLQLLEIPLPHPGPQDILVKVAACAVCRTDLHVVDGELPHPRLPLVPGHEIIGIVVETGIDVRLIQLGDRVGIPWLGWTCGHCRYCRSGRENLCTEALFTGYQRDGGYAAYALADQRYAFLIPSAYTDAEAAPLMCAGLIGYRALRMAADAEHVGLYGFGAAAHLLAQLLRFQGRKSYAFVRPGDKVAADFAYRQGVHWAGYSDQLPPHPLDAALIFAPDGRLLPAALRATVKGGTVICAGIHMSDIPAFPYRLLWEERSIRSVANLTRQDAIEFLNIAPRAGIRPDVKCFPLEQANEALAELRRGTLTGAAVLIP